MAQPEPTPGLAVALGAAFQGWYAHAGFLAGLRQGGLWPEKISGASSGALVAALAAAGHTPQEMIDWLASKHMRTAFHQWRRLFFAPVRRLTGFGTSGILNAEKARQRVAAKLGESDISQFSQPFLGVAVTNLTDGRGDILTSGPLIDAVMASMAWPVLFQARVVDKSACWDGGLVHEAPFSHWIDDPAVTTVLIHSGDRTDTVPARPELPEKMGVTTALIRAHEASSRELYSLRLRLAESLGKVVERHVTCVAQRGLFISEGTARDSFARGIKTGQLAAEKWQHLRR